MINKKYLFTLVLPLVIAVTGCDKLKDFDDTNKNPGATGDANIGALLTNVEAQIGGLAANTRAGLYAQYFSETQYTDVSIYANPKLDFTATYSGPLYDLQNIINLNQSNNQSQVAKILQQYIFWTLTDRWGDIPYTEALKGGAATTPKYDPQETVYKGMIATLKSAIDGFDGSSSITGDIIYGGDVASWKKLANSLRMLMAIQLSKRYPGANDYAATEFKAALNDPAGYISTNAENFDIAYPGGVYKHPWAAIYDGRKDYGESEPMVALLDDLNDPRIEVYGGATEQSKSAAPGSWNLSSDIGMPYGLLRSKSEAFTGANPTWARVLRGDFREETDTYVVISAAEVALARAEAADLGWTTENLTTVYQQGITLSFQQWGLPAPSASYFTQPDVALTAPAGTNANFKQVSLQRFIASYPDGLQGWNIWRKSGYPVLTPAPDAANSSKQIPRRYVYGNTEYGTNKASLDEAVARQGADNMDTRVWWDVQ